MPTYTVIGSTHARHHRNRTGPAAPDLVLGLGLGTSLSAAWKDACGRNPDLGDPEVAVKPAEAGQVPSRCSALDFGRHVLIAARLAWDESASADDIPARLRPDVAAFWRLTTTAEGPVAAAVKGQAATSLKASFGRAGTRDRVWLFAVAKPVDPDD